MLVILLPDFRHFSVAVWEAARVPSFRFYLKRWRSLFWTMCFHNGAVTQSSFTKRRGKFGVTQGLGPFCWRLVIPVANPSQHLFSHLIIKKKKKNCYTNYIRFFFFFLMAFDFMIRTVIIPHKLRQHPAGHGQPLRGWGGAGPAARQLLQPTPRMSSNRLGKF